MSVAEQYRELESRLPAEWADARFVLNVEDASRAERAASMLTAFQPGRVGGQVRFSVPRRGGKREQARRMMERIDREGIKGALELVTASEAPPEPAEFRAEWAPAAEQWDRAFAALPVDWTDVYAQVELDSSDFLDRGALLMAPLNPGPVQRRDRLPLPRRPLRLRRGARNDQALLRAARHGRDRRACDDPPRPGRHEAGHDPGPRLVHGRRARLMAGDPVSWLLIEPGWDVVARDGTEVGKVEEIVGDTGKDIFNGLSIATGLLAKPKYVPAERVRAITEGRVELDLSAEDAEALDEHDLQPPSEQFRAG